MRSETTDTLLRKILYNPSEENYRQIVSFISGDGYEDFVASLQRNTTLSIIFLKNYVDKWIESGILQNFYSEHFVTFLIQSCTENLIKENNWVHVAGFLEALSDRYLVPEHTLQSLIETVASNDKVLIFIDAIFKKYTKHPRSNRLFTEINRSVELFFPVFVKVFFAPEFLESMDSAYQYVLSSAQKAIVGKHVGVFTFPRPPRFHAPIDCLLSIFYSLVYQDIHPLFEDNAEHFFKVFFSIFDNNQSFVCDIFDLFIAKYPEITNFELIILTLCRVEETSVVTVNTLTSAFTHTRAFPAVVIGFLKRTLTTPEVEDWLGTTQSLIRGNDVERGSLHRLLRALNCDVRLFEGEIRFFVASVLRFKDRELLEEAFSIVKRQHPDHLLVFTTFRYLLTVQEYGLCDLGYLKTDVKFMAMKFLCNLIKSKDTYHRDALLSSRIFGHTSALRSVGQPTLASSIGLDVSAVLDFLRESPNEFASELLFRMVKEDERLLTLDLYNFIKHLFKSIDRIALTSLVFLFDVYILLSIIHKEYDFELVERILNEEMIDFYNICFLYISVLIAETTVKDSFIMHILSQDELWKTRELHSGLCFILIAAYGKGVVNKDQILTISKFLDGYMRTVLLHKASLPLSGSLSEEENYLLNGVFCDSWFVENFMAKKYARLVMKKLVRDESVPVEIRQKVVEKNLMNVEHELVLHSIVRYFDV